MGCVESRFKLAGQPKTSIVGGEGEGRKKRERKGKKMDAFEVSGRHAHDPKNSDPYGDDLRIGPAEVPKKGLNFPKNARNHLNTPPIHPKYAQNTRRHRKKNRKW